MTKLTKTLFFILMTLFVVSCSEEIHGNTNEPEKTTLPSGVIEGINIINDNTVTFVLYDMATDGFHYDNAYLLGDFNDWEKNKESQMKRDDSSNCWWITISNLESTKEYAFQYLLSTTKGKEVRVADPYSRKILDPYNDGKISISTYNENKTYPSKGEGIVSVLQIKPKSYDWKVENYKIEDPDNLIIYEMHFRDFTLLHDIKGAMKKLDYLESLGINAIELMPVQEFDANDSWGYNPCFYFAMDKAYGTDTMYKEFIDACHERGIAVILDVVYNHATGNNPFAKLYWNSDENKTAANNPYFNVDAPHPYSVFHDFNHESPLVRKFVKRNLEFLLKEYKFDGFRFDLAKGFTQKQCDESNAANYDASRVAIWKDYNNTVKKANKDAVVILELFADDNEERTLAKEGMKVWRNLNHSYCQSGMGWKDGSDFYRLYTGATNDMPFGAYIGYMESHDEERVAYKVKTWGNGDLKTNNENRLKSLGTNAAFFFTVPGPKMLWQFGEMAYDVNIDYNGRVGAKPIKWQYETSNADLVNTYRKLIHLRTSYPELFNADTKLDWRVGVNDWDNGRTLMLTAKDGRKIYVMGNFTTHPINFNIPSGEWFDYMNNNSNVQGDKSIAIAAHSFKLLTSFEAE